MAITDENALTAAIERARVEGISKIGPTMEVAGIYHFLGLSTGRPGVWAPGAPGLAGRVTDGRLAPDAGCIPCAAPAAGRRKYIGSLDFSASNAARLVLIDLLWVNSGIAPTTTTAQAIASVALPPRDAKGSTEGDGVEAGLLVTTVTGNGAAVTNTTLDYTNSKGVAGRVGTIPAAAPGGGFPATCVVGTLVPFSFDAGDDGVRSIQGITLGTSLVSGAVSLCLFRRLASLSLPAAFIGGYKGVVDTAMPRLYDGAALFPVLLAASTAAVNIFGEVSLLEG